MTITKQRDTAIKALETLIEACLDEYGKPCTPSIEALQTHIKTLWKLHAYQRDLLQPKE